MESVVELSGIDLADLDHAVFRVQVYLTEVVALKPGETGHDVGELFGGGRFLAAHIDSEPSELSLAIEDGLGLPIARCGPG